MKEIIMQWLYKGLELKTGEELYIAADGKDHQKELYKMFRKELEVMRNINPEDAAKLKIGCTFKDLRFWIFVKKMNITPLVGFKKSDDEVTRVTVASPRRTNAPPKM